MRTFEELLGAHMRRIGIRDGSLAWKLKLSRQAVYHWRKGDIKRPNCKKVAECAEVLRLTPAEREEFFLAAGCPPNPRDHNAKRGQQRGFVEEDIEAEDIVPAIPVTGVPINRPCQFFGRRRELKRIFKKWQHLPLESVAITGPRRSGKTSLLNYVKNTRTDQSLRDGQIGNPLPKSYKFVLVDFQTAGMCEPERLLSYLLEELALTVPEPCDLRIFTDVIRAELRKPAVILMDEIGVALQCRELDYQFWWGIRALVSNQTGGKLGLLLASHISPIELIPEGGGNKPSPFLNIIGQVLHLGPFTGEEAQELLACAPQPFNKEDIAWMLETSGRWPALLQMLCDTRMTSLEEGDTGDAWKTEALDRIAPYAYLLK
ncbi:MAG: ATP-binding protein [Gammaproteobacteria bacterium]|nr:ATP-binding protein [Gammaproteobacteria bacterium]